MRLTSGLSPLETRIDNLEDILDHLGELPKCWKGKKYYYNIPASFDIETTNYTQDGVKKATMYVWSFCICGWTITGRTWEQWLEALRILHERLETDDHLILIIYVHNLEFEFQWMRKWIEWDAVFAIDQRRPVYARTKTGIEFRCSYILSGTSLEYVGKNLQTYKVKKLVGDLDYSLPRHSGTPLTDEELSYSVNDVRVVTAYIQEKIEHDGSLASVQLTKTGYVRKYVRDQCLPRGKRRHKDPRALDYARLMQSLRLTPEEYLMSRDCFQGGFTHAAAAHVMQRLLKVCSEDLTSAYPAAMVAFRYPMSSGTRVKVQSLEHFRELLSMYCCMFRIRFRGLALREGVPDCPISESKCRHLSPDAVINNGRVAFADELETAITEVDFHTYEMYYTWDSIQIGEMWTYKRGYLPRPIVESVLHFYVGKTEYKDIPEKETEYALLKELLNSCFGMIVTDICRDEQVYGEDWEPPVAPDLDEALSQYNNSRKRFLFYPWGIYVTAYVRMIILRTMKALGDDQVYSDTDSVKFLHAERHVEVFRAHNEWITGMINRALDYHRLPRDLGCPKTVKGKPKPLGVFDHDADYDEFKTLGAKRYMYRKPHALKVGSEEYDVSLTVSGVNKKTAIPWMMKSGRDPFDMFDNALTIPAGAAGKLTHSYLDSEIHGTLRDYTGTSREVYERSCVHLEPAEYNLSITAQYIDYLKGYREIWK